MIPPRRSLAVTHLIYRREHPRPGGAQERKDRLVAYLRVHREPIAASALWHAVCSGVSPATMRISMVELESEGLVRSERGYQIGLLPSNHTYYTLNAFHPDNVTTRGER